MKNAGKISKLFSSAAVVLLGMSSVQADLSQDLVGYYPFESDYTNSVTSGGLPNGSAVNTPTAGTAGGRAGNAMSVQGGDNDHMNLVASFGSGNTLGTSFTVSTWYKLNEPVTSTTTTERYFIYEASNNYDISYALRDLSAGVAGPNDGQVHTQSGNFSVADAGAGGWHHVIQTYSPDGGDVKIQTWLDGAHVGDLSVASGDFSGAGINFGAARSSVTVRGFDGLIDEVAIWDRVLTSAELASVYALGLNDKPVLPSGAPSTAPTITSFTATPSATLIGETVALAWNVMGSTSVTIVDELGNVAASGNQNVTLNAPKTYTLVALNGNAIETSQVSIAVNGPSDPVGPLVGTVKQTEAYFLYRPGPEEINLRLTVMTGAGTTVATDDSTSLAANDHVAKFHITGLTAGTTYRYKVEKVEGGGGLVLFAGDDAEHQFSTVKTSRTGQIFTAAFTSCVNDSTDDVWLEMMNHNADILLLCGDTPYVDTGTLSTIRSKHRHLLQRQNLRNLIRKTPVIGTWDDHDFGLNGGNGVNTSSRKVNTRRGFIEYRAHDQYGDGANNGIYHKADMGAIEFFMLDPRWFSQTTASPIDASQPTCFGSAQWTWLLDAIRNSEAPFKVLVQGQIWQDKKNSETDDMFTYWAERDALLNTIRDERIPGVVLFGGDIHVARQLMHPRRVGYNLYDFIMSPGHTSVISSLDVYHSSYEWSLAGPNQFLTMTADTTKTVPELTVKYLGKNGELNHQVVLTYDQLSYNEGSGLAKGLRGYWSFDIDLKNESSLGDRLDATAVNGATRANTGGALSGAVSFDRADEEYLRITRSYLDDNSKEYSVSSWCKTNSLPAHGSSDRHFLMESYAHNYTGKGKASTTGYCISVGLATSSTDSSKVNLQLYTETLNPVQYVTNPSNAQSLLAPGKTFPGPFNWDLDRSLFASWTNVVVTFDSTKLKLYVNGTLAIEHTLNIAAPIAETGGLIIGGHRGGAGRNFDGMIDEVAIWNRVLDAADITALYNGGSPAAIPTSTVQIDTDGDVLPDWWEDIHGLNKNSAADATSDTDLDGLNALQEFGFGTLPNVADSPKPYSQTTINVSGTDYQAITYTRNPAAMEHMDQVVQRSTDLGISDAWDAIETVVVNVTDLPNGLQQVTERSTVALDGQNREFLRVYFSEKN